MQQEIGGIAIGQEEVAKDEGCSGDTYYLHPETQYSSGENTIDSITLYDSGNAAYTVQLADSFTIREPDSPPPSISYATVSGYNSFAQVESPDGGSFQVTLPTAAQFGTKTQETSEIVSGSGWGSPVNTTSSKYVYAARGSSAKENKVTSGSGCSSSTTTYYYYEYTYYKYIRYQYQYEQTSGTRFYNTVNGLTGWNVGGQVYAPGTTITVSGNVTATPVVGQLSRTFLREETVTMVHTTQKDVADGTAKYSQPNTTYKSADAAAKGTEYTTNQPSGYSWYNTTDRFDSSWVNTTETQVGEDYQKN